MYFRGGGIKVANNLAVTEKGYALDARQGKVLDEKIAETKNDLLKMIQASGVLSGNVDWNNYTTAGVYKVQNATMTAEYHAPVGFYGFGTLVVSVAETGGELRKVQKFYPDRVINGNVIAIRPYNHILGTDFVDTNWRQWYKISGQPLE